MKATHLKGGKGQRSIPNRVDVKKSENDAIFMYNVAVLVGCPCEVTIKDGRKYDGIFCAYDQDKHELLFEAAHLVTDDTNDEAPITEHHDVLVVPSHKMLSARFKSVDTNYATRDFVTDQAIASSRSSSLRDKELTPWDGPDVTSDDDLSLDVDVSTKENGWEAKDMFKKNEEKYGVTSSYSQDLSGYTTKIDKSDPDTLKRHEQRASQVANEIEKNVVSWERGELENGEDEEEAFSAVVRPSRNSAVHPNLNNNNNSSSNNSGDKYIPPSRRQGNSQPSAQSMPQNVPLNNNGASQMNNNSSNPRKPMYGQNQNPRGGGYGGGPIQNNVQYHDRRSNYDNRRGPPPNQYPVPTSSHNEQRRMEDGNRQQQQQQQQHNRVPNKPQTDRRVGSGGGGREDPAKLKEFGMNFRLQTPSEVQPMPRRMPTPSNQTSNAPPSASGPPNIPSGVPNTGVQMPTRNSSPPSNNTSLAKSKEDTPPPPSTPQGLADATEKGNSGAANLTINNSSGIGSINNSMNEMLLTPASGASTNDSGTCGTPGSDDSKLSDSEPKKKFSFNPNAKEFNPCAKSFSSRSPSTPPRPPSTPAQAPSTPQIMPLPQMPSFMQIPMPMLYAQPYAQTAGMTTSSNSSASSAGATPSSPNGVYLSRHGGHRKGGGMLGVPPRSDMTPPIQMTSGPPLLAQASIQPSSAPPLYAFVPGQYPQVMRGVPQTVMPVFHSEGSGSSPMQQQVHYIQHNGAPTPNSGGHPNSNTPNNTPSQTTVVSANSQGYSQSGGNHGGGPHVGYPFVGVSVMNIPGYPHGPPPHMILPYVPHSHQGEYQGKATF